MLDDDDCAACVGLNLAQEGPERLGLLLSDACRRLVKQNHRRILGQYASQLHNAAGSGGQVRGWHVGKAAKAEQTNKLVGTLVGRDSESIHAGSLKEVHSVLGW
jgi:hypothetical protein